MCSSGEKKKNRPHIPPAAFSSSPLPLSLLPLFVMSVQDVPDVAQPATLYLGQQSAMSTLLQRYRLKGISLALWL